MNLIAQFRKEGLDLVASAAARRVFRCLAELLNVLTHVLIPIDSQRTASRRGSARRLMGTIAASRRLGAVRKNPVNREATRCNEASDLRGSDRRFLLGREQNHDACRNLLFVAFDPIQVCMASSVESKAKTGTHPCHSSYRQ